MKAGLLLRLHAFAEPCYDCQGVESFEEFSLFEEGQALFVEKPFSFNERIENKKSSK